MEWNRVRNGYAAVFIVAVVMQLIGGAIGRVGMAMLGVAAATAGVLLSVNFRGMARDAADHAYVRAPIAPQIATRRNLRVFGAVLVVLGVYLVVEAIRGR